MTDKKELNQEELEEVSGGQGLNNTILMTIGLTFKFDEQGNELYKEIQLKFNKRFTTKVSDAEIEAGCKEYCEKNFIQYVSFVVKNSYAY